MLILYVTYFFIYLYLYITFKCYNLQIYIFWTKPQISFNNSTDKTYTPIQTQNLLTVDLKTACKSNSQQPFRCRDYMNDLSF